MRGSLLSLAATLTAQWWALAAGLLFALPSFARPGGGHGFSSSGGGGFSSSGGGGWSSSGGGDADPIMLVVYIVIFVLVLVVKAMAKSDEQKINWASARAQDEWERQQALPRRGPSLEVIAHRDADFSVVLFHDWFFRLYAAAWGARHDGEKLDGLRPYLSANARKILEGRSPQGNPFSKVVVGSVKTISVATPDAANPDAPYLVVLEVESNLTSTSTTGKETTWYSMERWTLRRNAAATSRPPEKVESLGCPSCGAPFETTDHRTCNYCNETVTAGEHDWLVSGIRVRASRPTPPQLGGYAPERGTSLPTHFHPALDERWRALKEEGFDLERFGTRLLVIFGELNEGWSDNDLDRIRPYVSDGQFDSLRYWIEAYTAQHLQNRNDDARVLNWDQVKVVRDKYYDAITVRIFADGFDRTVSTPTMQVIGGSKTSRRKYSEYWTLIKSRGKRAPDHDDVHCPNCGAALAITMGGNCEHCDAHVTSGEFDWVLAQIEQDESYGG